MKKRFGSILLTLALLVGLMPWSALPARASASYVAQIGETGYATVQAAINAAQNGDTVTLLADVTTDSTITVNTGTEESPVTLDLAGHVIDRGLATLAKSGGYVMNVKMNASLTLVDSAPEATHTGSYANLPTGGVITGGNNNSHSDTNTGGGVVVDGTFTMSGGTIYHNTASDGSNGKGGGVYVNGGKFHMTGGSISDNTAANGGGGVYVTDGGEFHMSGTAKLSGNKARQGGGVRVFSNGTFTMESGATVSGNSSNSGGGVYVGGTFTMNGGAISGNNAEGTGGGVCVDGTFTMTGGTISGNNTTEDGGGVYVFNIGTFNVSGGATVTGNKLGGTFENGSLTGGTANNAYLFVGNMITVAGALSSNASIGVTAVEEAPNKDNPYETTYQTRTDAFTSGLASGGTNALACFASDVEGYAVGLNAQGEAALMKPWSALQSQLNAGGTVTLTRDVTAGESDTALVIPSDKTVTLDLAGFTIDRGLTSATENGNVITVNGTLTVTDSSADEDHPYGVGTITGGYNKYSENGAHGGGVYVSPTGSFTLAGGTISGNHVDEDYGGGVFVDYDHETYSCGQFTMTGGAISGNTAQYGGGVYVYTGYDDNGNIISVFNMSGGTISGNTASGEGGGISGGNVVMSGDAGVTGNTGVGRSGIVCESLSMSGNAAITGNHSTGTSGASLAVNFYGSISLSGNVRITGNTNGDNKPANVPVSGYKTLNIAGDLGSNASIGVTAWDNVSTDSPLVFTNGLSGHGAATNFTSDQGYAVSLSGNGEAQLSGNTVTFYHYGYTTWHVAFAEYQTVAVAVGAKVSRPTDPADPSLSHDLTFGGWYTDSACTQEYDFDTVVTGALELYPRWQRTLADADVVLADGTYTYSGSAFTPTVTVTGMTSIVKTNEGSFPTGTLTEGTDYTVTYTNNVNAGTATVTVTGTRFNKGTVTKTFTIGKASIASPTVTVTGGPYVYTGGEIKPTITVKTGDTPLAETDYAVSFGNNVNAGGGTITVTAKSGGNYTFEAVEQSFTIVPKAVTVKADAKSKTYGEDDPALTATVTGLVGSDKLTYTVTRAAGEDVGTYTITPSGEATQGNYTVTYQTGTFTITINRKAVTAAMISAIAAQTYTGKEIKPTVTVKDGSTTLTSNDYTVAYSNNTDPGTATVTVTGKGNYTGTATATFQIYGVKGAWENSKLKATVNVSDPANTLLIAAVYDGNGKQVDVKVVGLAANKTAYETGVTTKTSGYTYNLMVVSKSTYAPLCAAWSEKA